MKTKWVTTVLGGIVLVALLLLAFALGQAYRAREFGNAFLSDVGKLRVGQSTYEDVLRVQARYRSRSSVEGGSCDRNLCVLAFSAGNEWLYRLGLVPGAMFVGSMTVKQGRLARVSASLQSNPQLDAAMDEIPAEQNVEAYEVGGKHFISRPAYSYVWAHITSAASENERRKVYAFNMGCLTRWGGCKDSNEILPILRPLGPKDLGPLPPTTE
jgi:hypothetical protein